RQRAERDAAAHLRHRVRERGGAGRAPEARRGSVEARPPAARARTGPLLDPRGGRAGARPLAPEARYGAARARGLLEGRALQARLPVRVHAAHREREALPDLRAPPELRRYHVLADADRRAGVPRETDELPGPHHDLQLAQAQLP